MTAVSATPTASTATATGATGEEVDYAAAPSEIEFDKDEGGTPPPALYEHSATATGIPGFESVGDEAVDFYKTYGYLVVDDAFAPAEVETALAGLMYLIEGNRPDFRGIQYEGAVRKTLHTIPLEKRQDYVRKLISYVDYEERLKALSEHPTLLGAVTRLIGEAPALFANQALLKPPLVGREKPWHQDHAYFNLPMGTPIIGCWISLDHAVPENGCMHVVPGTHHDGPVVHFRRRDWQICDDQVQVGKIMAVPLRPGGILFFDGLLHHGTPPTTSVIRRRALQFHYCPASVARITAEERLKVFGSEGKNVTC
ncbi:MAG TPA: phytanoyl-CoA dioxygenase family protein [Chloroflexota bacterium]|nr:phytanoyl-CoA dioxygenase family protein [Chloroflexota bacterium]